MPNHGGCIVLGFVVLFWGWNSIVVFFVLFFSYNGFLIFFVVLCLVIFVVISFYSSVLVCFSGGGFFFIFVLFILFTFLFICLFWVYVCVFLDFGFRNRFRNAILAEFFGILHELNFLYQMDRKSPLQLQIEGNSFSFMFIDQYYKWDSYLGNLSNLGGVSSCLGRGNMYCFLKRMHFCFLVIFTIFGKKRTKL